MDPDAALGARVAASSTLRASSLTGVSGTDLPGGPADKDATVYRAYVLVTPSTADSVVATLDPFLWAGVTLAVALIAATAAVATHRALRPVEVMRATAAHISGSPNGARLAVPEARDELRALAHTLNAMLGRIDEAAVRQKRFTADAAHELRSPLASLIAALDVARAHPDAVPPERTLAHVESEARRLADLAEELLQLSSAERMPVDDAPTIDAAAVVRTSAVGMRVPVSITSPETAPVRIDARSLERVVRNLLYNAARHAATEVRVSVHVDDDVLRIDVSNDGPPIEHDDTERIFQPFVRLDTSRSRDTGGAGLGLTIAREIVARQGGALTASSEPTCTTFTVSLPRRGGALTRPPARVDGYGRLET